MSTLLDFVYPGLESGQLLLATGESREALKRATWLSSVLQGPSTWVSDSPNMMSVFVQWYEIKHGGECHTSRIHGIHCGQ